MATSSALGSRRITEVNVPTPWGHLATKCWNLPTENPSDLSASKQLPVICLHGWQDNAGTFDKLIPLLDEDIPFICMDFAGHGKSSHRPPGASGDGSMYSFDVMRLVNHFGLSDSGFNLMGHSMGGGVSISLAGAFPQMVRKCLTFDAPALFPRKYEDAPKFLANAIKKHLEHESGGKLAPKYSFDEAFQRFAKGRSHQMTDESAKILLKRGLKLVDETESGESLYEFSRDIKVTFPSLLPYGVDTVKAFVKNVSCHLRLFIFKDNHWAALEAVDEEWHAKMMELRKEVFQVYEKNCRSFKLVEVDGRHHAHLDHPEPFAAEVNSFLKMGDSKL